MPNSVACKTKHPLLVILFLILHFAQCYKTLNTYTFRRRYPTSYFTLNVQESNLPLHAHHDDKKYKASIQGVSISPSGFLALLSTSMPDGSTFILPIRVSSSLEDAYSASSPESLTICQLLSGVDMAGAMLKPSILNEIVALSSCIGDMSSDQGSENVLTRSWVNQWIAKTLDTSYVIAPPWERNKVLFPTIQLVGVEIQLISDDAHTLDSSKGPFPLKFILDCRVEQSRPLYVPLYSEVQYLQSNKNEDLECDLVNSELILRQCLYTFDESTSAAYLALSLALRYKAPIYISSKVISTLNHVLDNTTASVEQVIERIFPKWTSSSMVQTMSVRTVKDMEQSYTVKKLTRALEVAKSKGDKLAATKIELEICRLKDVDRRVEDRDWDGGILG